MRFFNSSNFQLDRPCEDVNADDGKQRQRQQPGNRPGDREQSAALPAQDLDCDSDREVEDASDSAEL